MRSVVGVAVTQRKSRMAPRKVIVCDGVNLDLLWLIREQRRDTRLHIVVAAKVASTPECPTISQILRYWNNKMSERHRWAATT